MAIPVMPKRLQDDICFCANCLEQQPWKVGFQVQVSASLKRGRYLTQPAHSGDDDDNDNSR